MSEVTSRGAALVKKPAFIVGGGVAAAYVVYRYYKSKSAAGVTAPSGATDTSQTVDPTTGVPYSEEYGYGSSYGTAVGNPAANPSGGLSYDAATGQYEFNHIPVGYTNQGASSTATAAINPFTGATATDAMGTLYAVGDKPDYSVPYVTGDVYQDQVLAKSPEILGSYNAFRSNPNPQTSQAYATAYNQYVTNLAAANKPAS